MASDVDICNVALSLLGARAQVASIAPPDGSVEAGYCARFYPLARREVLEAVNFAATKTRVQLAAVANPSDTWAYAYAKPSDCLRALRVLPLTQLSTAGIALPLGWAMTPADWVRVDHAITERGSAAFDVEGDTILTDEPEAVLVYKRDVTDVNKLPPLCQAAIGRVLAGYLAGPIIKGLEGAKVGAHWTEQGYAIMAKAAASDANGSEEAAGHVPQHIAARA